MATCRMAPIAGSTNVKYVVTILHVEVVVRHRRRGSFSLATACHDAAVDPQSIILPRRRLSHSQGAVDSRYESRQRLHAGGAALCVC